MLCVVAPTVIILEARPLDGATKSILFIRLIIVVMRV